MSAERPNRGNSMSMDTELGRMVVELRLATSEEIDRCATIQSDVAQAESQKSLAQVMVDQGVVTKSQIVRLKTAIEESHGQQIPGYQLLSKLGSGAMATVFKAKQLSLDRIVAIKVLPRKLSENVERSEEHTSELQSR